MLNRRQTAARAGPHPKETSSTSGTANNPPSFARANTSTSHSNDTFTTLKLVVFLSALVIAIIWVSQAVNISQDDFFRDFMPSREMVKNQIRENILKDDTHRAKHLFLREGRPNPKDTELHVEADAHRDEQCDLLVQVANNQQYHFYISRWLLDSSLPVGGNSRLKGIVLLFHGCSHFGDQWNLAPEERQVVVQLHKAGFAVVAFTSTAATQEPDGDRCWQTFSGWELSTEPQEVTCNAEQIQDTRTNLLENSGDVQMVRSIVKSLLHGAPLLKYISWNAVGASSGGIFATTLMQPSILPGVHLSKVVAYVSSVHSDVARLFESCGQSTLVEQFWPKGFPSVLYVHMPNDEGTMFDIKEQMNDLSGVGVKVDEIQCPPTRITENSLNELLGMPHEAKVEIIELFKEREYISSDNMWKVNSRKLNLGEPVGDIVRKYWNAWDRNVGCKKGEPELLPTSPDQAVEMITEIMHATCAYHEFTHYRAKAVREWLIHGQLPETA